MRTIYYITRSYPALREHAGGSSLLRKAAVEQLRKHGFKVIVIAPNYGSTNITKYDNDGVVLIPYNKNEKVSRIKQRIGLLEDYLDEWVSNVLQYFSNTIRPNDIIFSTTGGELATIKIGSILKRNYGCHSIINFRDPINYATYNGLRRDNLWHLNRDKLEKKYLSNASLILTSCKTFKEVLSYKYPDLSRLIFNNYFGYAGETKSKVLHSNLSSKLRIVYGGNFSSTQAPENICRAISTHPQKNKIDLTLIGNYKNYKPINKYIDQFTFIDKLSRQEYSNFIIENADVGFVPLNSAYYQFCFPSKIFEYLNHGLTILGALPKGDALDFINHNKYGIAVNFQNHVHLSDAITSLLNKSTLSAFQTKIINENRQWSMNELIVPVIEKIKALENINSIS